MLIYLTAFITFSILGWFFDTAYRSITEGKYSSNTYFPLFSIAYGICGTFLLALYKNTTLPITEYTAIGTISITLFELTSGIFCVNVLKRRFWDYSKNKYNFKGHIDALHVAYWFMLTALLRITLPNLPV